MSDPKPIPRPLPICHSRHALADTDERFFCAHPRVFATRSVVSYEFCRACDYWRLPAPSEPRRVPARLIDHRPGPCRYLGDEIGLRRCATCRGDVRVKVFACRHPAHAETTLGDCEACDDFDQTS